MKLKPGISGVMKPQGDQERLYKCEQCGTVFMKKPLMPLLPVKCPHCGSFRTGTDSRVSY